MGLRIGLVSKGLVGMLASNPKLTAKQKPPVGGFYSGYEYDLFIKQTKHISASFIHI